MPGGSAGQSQVNDPSNPGHFGGTSCINFPNLTTGPTNVDCDQHTKGPNPGVDIVRFGARPVNINTFGSNLQYTATCNGTTTVTVDAARAIQNGDGVTLSNCGATPTISTPSAPTGAAVMAVGPLKSGVAVNQSTPSGVTRFYKIAAFDIGRGITLPSTEVSVTSNTLGQVSWTISTLSRSNAAVTVVTSVANTLVAGAGVCINGTSDDTDFGGCYTVSSITNGTTFVIGITQADTRWGFGASATGGTVFATNMIRLTLPAFTAGQQGYIIYMGTSSGAETFYGYSLPNFTSGGDAAALIFDDAGATLSGGMTQQWWIPTNPLASVQNDELSTTIVSGAGTTTWTLATPALNSGTGVALFDDWPAMLAAAQAATNTSNGGGQVILPAIPSVAAAAMKWQFSAPMYLNGVNLSTPVGINQIGQVNASDTIYLNGQWNGKLSLNTREYSNPSFALEPRIQLGLSGYPGIWLQTINSTIKGVTTSSPGNNYIGVFDTNTNGHVIEDVSFTAANASNCGELYYYFAQSGAGGFGFQMRNVSFLPTTQPSFGTTTCPAVIARNTGEMNFDYISMGGRGFFTIPTTAGLQLNWTMGEEEQGGGLPMISLYNATNGVSGWMHIRNTIQDTIGAPLIVNYPGQPTGQLNSIGVEIDGSNGPQSNMPLVSGASFSPLIIRFVGNATSPQRSGVVSSWFHRNGSSDIYSGGFIHSYGPNGSTGFGSGQITTPAAPTLAVTTVGCGATFLPAGSYHYGTLVVDATTAGFTTIGALSNTVALDGTTQCIQATAPALPAGSAFWALGGGSGNPVGAGTWARMTAGAANCPCGVCYAAPSTTTVTLSGNFACQGLPAANTTSLNVVSPTVLAGNVQAATDTTLGQCFSSASPAVCGSFINGFVTIAAAASTVTVNTTSVTANSEISLTFDATMGGPLGVTCNTTAQQPYVTAKTAGTSFVISVPTAFTTNPGCIGFHIKN